MEFKGTKGQWLLHKKAYCCVVSEENEKIIANCGGFTSASEYDKVFIQQKANTVLVSKAPEMLEMLIYIYNKKSLYHEDLTNIKQLIKEATEI